MTISVHHLEKSFSDGRTSATAPSGRFSAVDDVSFDVPKGSLTALLGPSGGGKSTVLRIVAGLEEPDSGSVFIDGARVDGVHARERRVGFVFQHYALFRHMSVVENVAFGPVAQGTSKIVARKRAEELLDVVGLAGYGNRKPHELSGGQRQRVALARALAPEPKVLLLDEPFSAVDARVREDLRTYLKRIHEERGITTVFVTHDQGEAFDLADRVIVINQGRVEQNATPGEIIRRPANEFVAWFVRGAAAISYSI